MVIVTGGKETTIRGTYLHPLLVPALAMWISPKFGVSASRIVNDYIAREYKAQLRQKDNTINVLLNKVVGLEIKVDSLSEQLRAVSENTGEILEKFGAVSTNRFPLNECKIHSRSSLLC